jgi:Fungal specific transcription factor domain
MMHRNERPWEKSEEAWVTAQSLCLLKIRSDTMEQPDLQASSLLEIKQSLIFSVASRDDFGFTVGASQGLIRCIYDITSLTSWRYYGDVRTRQSAIVELYQRLSNCNLQFTPNKELVQLHHRIFKSGVLIHFHRRILNSTPRTLIPHLDTLLRDVTAYQGLEKGYVTLWPVFVGAVEAYEEEHKSCVRTWLDKTERIGAASRGHIRSLIEAVWQERKRKRDEIGEGAEEGDVVVDWRKVMGRMGMDVLLV